MKKVSDVLIFVFESKEQSGGMRRADAVVLEPAYILRHAAALIKEFQ